MVKFPFLGHVELLCILFFKLFLLITYHLAAFKLGLDTDLFTCLFFAKSFTFVVGFVEKVISL